MKGTFAVGLIVIIILCLSISSAFTLNVNAQQSSAIGKPTAFVTQLLKFTWANQLWSFTLPNNYGGVTSPIVADGLVYITSGETLYCVNASSGAQVWSQPLNTYWFTVAEGCVYVDATVQLYPPPHNAGGFCCFNASDGVLLWTYTNGTNFGVPVADEANVYVGDGEVNGSSVFALNALTGAKIWSFLGPVGTSFDWNNLLFSGAVVYAFSSFGQESSPLHSGVWALNTSSGEILWNYTAPAQFSSFATDGQNIYVCSNSTDYAGTVFALTANGTEKWHDPIKGSATSLIVANGMVYAGCGNGNVYAFDASDGKVSWRYSVGPSFNSDLYVDGYLYVGSSFGVYCLDAFNGALIWNTKINSATNPTYACGIIYVGESGPMFFSPAIQHTFYALNAASGRTLWSYTFPNVGFTCAVADGTVYIGADWVTHLSPDNIGPGRLFALKPSLTSLPLPPVTLWESTILAIRIAAVLAVIIILTVVFVPRKRLKNKPSSFKRYD